MRREMGSDGSWDLSLSCEKVLKISSFDTKPNLCIP